MTAARAIDRTVTLLGGDVFPDLDRDLLAAELTTSRLIIRADRDNLSSAAAQTALVTTFTCIARCGFRVQLELPEVDLIGPQPPLRGRLLRRGLLDLGSDLIPPVTSDPAPPGTVEVLLGSTPALGDGEALRIGGGDWHAEVRVGAGTSVEPLGGTIHFGAILAGIAASAEVLRVALARIRDRHRLEVAREFDLDGPREIELRLPALELPSPIVLGAVDFISGGAITNGCLYTLLREAVAGTFRIIDADLAELTNLNRYALLRHSELDEPKVLLLAGYEREELTIEPLPRRLDAESAAHITPLAPRVVCGVDDIPSRWLVQEISPAWLCVGGTSHFTVLVSEHTADMPCAGCLHPEDDLDAPAELPTISFTSLLAGVLQAHRLLATSCGCDPRLPTLGWSFNLRASGALEEIGLAARDDCPVGCRLALVERERQELPEVMVTPSVAAQTPSVTGS